MCRLRICQLITELATGGAERNVCDLATRLDAARFEVQVVALRGGPTADWLAQDGVDVTVLDVPDSWIIGRFTAVADLLKSRRVELLHTHMFHADFVGRLSAATAGVRSLVHTIHVAEGRFSPWQFAVNRFLSGRCDRLVCFSASARDWHARRAGLPTSRYSVIPGGIDSEAFARDDGARRCLRGEWGVDESDVVILFVGRLHRDKGVDTLLAAMSHLGARGNPKTLVVAGDGSERPMVETFISHGEGGARCRRIDPTRDVRDILSAADVFAMPSRWEGFPTAVAEAMAAGLPVVASSLPSTAEMISHGETGMLVDREDVVGLAETLEELAGDADLRRRLGANAARHVALTYPIERMIAAHEQLYTALAGAGD